MQIDIFILGFEKINK